MNTTSLTITFEKLGEAINHDDGFFRGNQCPTPLLLDENTLRVYYTARGKDNKTYPFYVDLDAGDLRCVIRQAEKPLFDFGAVGTFDDVGIVPCQAWREGNTTYLYYQGFNLSSPARYKTAIGIAIDKGNGFERRNSPIFDRSEHDPIAVGTPFVHGGTMYYLSHSKWEVSPLSGMYEPFYSIKQTQVRRYDEMEPGPAEFIFPITPDVGGIARPWIFEHAGRRYMAFCQRGNGDYRKSTDQTYKTRVAELVGGTWTRRHVEFKGPDELMMAYPAIATTRAGTFLLYNNDFTSGLQIARLSE